MQPSRRVLLCLLIPSVMLVSAASTTKPVNDSAIHDQVLMKLAGDPQVRGGDLVVSVHNGVVTLSGKVENPNQKDKAGKIASKVRGVKGVVNNITFVKP